MITSALVLVAVLGLGAAPAPAPAPATLPALVDVASLAPTIRLEMRYATPANFLKEAVYPCARCLLRSEAAEALARVEASLAPRGLHLKVWDCYRPPSVQSKMWAILPDARYVANPRTGSRHGRGGAVDLTIVDANGAELEMPTRHDDFTEAARADAAATEAATRNRATLRSAMEAEGFSIAATEWWHFNAKDSKEWPLVEAQLCKHRVDFTP